MTKISGRRGSLEVRFHHHASGAIWLALPARLGRAPCPAVKRAQTSRPESTVCAAMCSSLPFISHGHTARVDLRVTRAPGAGPHTERDANLAARPLAEDPPARWAIRAARPPLRP